MDLGNEKGVLKWHFLLPLSFIQLNKPQDDTTGFRATINAEEDNCEYMGLFGYYKQRSYEYCETTRRKSPKNNGPQTGVDPNFVVADIYIIWRGPLCKIRYKKWTLKWKKNTMTTLTLETALLFCCCWISLGDCQKFSPRSLLIAPLLSTLVLKLSTTPRVHKGPCKWALAIKHHW